MVFSHISKHASNAISSGGLVETSYANNSVTIGEGTKIEVGEGKDVWETDKAIFLCFKCWSGAKE